MKKTKRKLVERTRAGKTMTEAAFFGMIRSSLRRTRWRPKYEALTNAKKYVTLYNEDGTEVLLKSGKNKGKPKVVPLYTCADCKEDFRGKDVEVDHIIPCGSLKVWEDLVGFAQRLPKILHWDVETSLMSVYTFGLFNQDISIGNIIDDWFMICAAWQWDHEKKPQGVSVLDDAKRFKANHRDDYHVVKAMHAVLKEADVIVAHNGDAFDIKKFNARAIIHKLEPLPPIPSVDTLKVARKNFKFTSNKLDYITRYFGVGKKMSNPAGLWRDATEGDVKAIKHMAKYNKVDVIELKNIFDILRPYMTNLNMNMFADGHGFKCPKCLSENVQKQGKRVTKTQVYNRYQCQDCGGWSSDKANATPFEKKQRMLK